MQRKLVTTGVTLAAAVLMCAADASAGWWGSHGGSWGGSAHMHWGGSGGSSGGSSGGYVTSYGSGGGSWGSHGSHGGGLFARWHARRAARWSHSSGGSYGSYGSHGSSGGSWGSHGGSSGGSSGGYMVPHYGTPMEYAPMDQGVPVDSAPAASLDRDAGGLTVSVPADAKVFVNDKPTTSTGTVREYISRGLEPGLQYSYQVRVEAMRDGQLVTDTKTVSLQAGRMHRINFDFAREQSVETVLNLNVPADAKVTLAGSATSSTGNEREYKTTTLAPGQTWSNYDIVVTVERDGQTLTKQQTIDLVGGKSTSLTFDFDSASVASR